MHPETRYARSGDLNIAYQVVGEGPLDLVMVPGFVSHIDLYWSDPHIAPFLTRLAAFARLILFDKRGSGCSDPTTGLPTLEERMDDVRAIMDAAGSDRAALFGLSEGGPMSVLFAATYPERTRALVLYGSYPGGPRRDDDVSEFGRSAQRVMRAAENWGDGRTLEIFMPSMTGGETQRLYRGMFERAAASPSMVRGLLNGVLDIDVRDVLPTIQVPTLVLHRTGDHIPVSAGRQLADHIPGAKFVELEGVDHLPWIGDGESVAAEIEEFLTGIRRVPEPSRVLATVLFADIVGSTQRAAELGDGRWRDVLESFYRLAQRQIDLHRGREVKTSGDGFLAVFDGPARALRCARAIATEVRTLELEVRAGVHTGEVEVLGADVGGLAVHIGARVCALATAGEVLASRTVRDLVVGSGLSFRDRGTHTLKGVPGEWQLLAVTGDGEGDEDETPVIDERVESPLVRFARRRPAVARAVIGMSRRGDRTR